MERNVIHLTGEKELKIFMDPLRQKILRLLAQGEPHTAKQLADRLSITPSSAKHHLTQLQSIGLVALHHTQQIRGITASYYQYCPCTVRLGLEDDEFADQRQLLAENLLMDVYRGFRDYMDAHKGRSDLPQAELMTGMIHLTPQEALELRALVQSFVERRDQPGPDTVPYEYALMAYQAGAQP